MRRHVIIIFAVILFSIIACSSPGLKPIQSPLSGRIICVDPGHGGTAATDDYRVGPSGEREEWINLRVALRLREGLISRGAEVLLTRSEDVDVPLKERARKAVGSKVDAFISIHHNATADREVNFPIIYYHGNASENRASVRMARLVAQHLKETLFSEDHPVSVVSDHVIFPNTGTAILRHSYGIPGIIGEASFFTNPSEEDRLRDTAYNHMEAEAYTRALEMYFSVPPLPIEPKYSRNRVSPFHVFEESERMSPIALQWEKDFIAGRRLFQEDHPDSLAKAFMLLSRSARSFPDSYLARECHQFRARLLERFGRLKEAAEEQARVEEYFVDTRLSDAR